MPWTTLKGLSECQPGQHLDITNEANEDFMPEEAWRAPEQPAAAPSVPPTSPYPNIHVFIFVIGSAGNPETTLGTTAAAGAACAV